jgi:hypothetical protein
VSELLDYDETLLSSLHHIENILVKFALQNYVSAGAVFLAAFTGSVPNWVAAIVVIVLAVLFIWAILNNTLRYNVLWKMHRVARDKWLATQTALDQSLRDDPDITRYLGIHALPRTNFVPLILANFLPALAAGLLLLVG